MSTTSHVYEIIIDATPETVWKAITDGEQTQKYYFDGRVESDWKAGSTYHYYGPDGSVISDGNIVEIEAQSHLKTTWRPAWLGDAPASTVIWDVQSVGPVTLLKLTHTDVDDATFEEAQFHVGWIFVISSMKSLLETGKALPSIM
jgi:uncharacterized protein YndB with AHSA1/START domain